MSDQAKDNQTPFSVPKKLVRINYDYDVYGGAIGDIELPFYLAPDEAITQAFIEEVVGDNPTSGGSATIALKVVNANDILAATAYNNAVFTGTFGACVPVDTAGTFVKNTGTTEGQLTMTVATAALTGGSFNVVLEVMG